MTVNSTELYYISKFKTVMTIVGAKIKQQREFLNLTQQQVANELGVSVTTVKNWEAGRHIPKLYLNQTKALCDLLKLTLEDFTE